MASKTHSVDHHVSGERDAAAAVLSLLPGMGHVYKGHVGLGLGLLLGGTPIALWMGALLALATMGLGLIVPLGFWIGVAWDAYCIADNRQVH
jgi:hypothetical protein